MSGKMKALSDEERNKIVREIHYSYREEVKKMSRLSNEEIKQIAEEVHRDYEEVVKKVAQDSEILNRLSHERAVAKIEQEKQDKKSLKEMKGSFFKRLFGLS